MANAEKKLLHFSYPLIHSRSLLSRQAANYKKQTKTPYLEKSRALEW
jgi:hypothetical protein